MSKVHAQLLVTTTVNLVAVLKGYFEAPEDVALNLMSELISGADTTYQGLWNTVDQRYLVVENGDREEGWVRLAFQSEHAEEDSWLFLIEAYGEVLSLIHNPHN